jgi:hypothetical protein
MLELLKDILSWIGHVQFPKDLLSRIEGEWLGRSWWIYFAAYFAVWVVGWLAVAVCLYVMRWLVLKKENRPRFSDWPAFLGGIERVVALTLVLWAPPYLPSFIGGWVLLKFAIGWQREEYGGEDKRDVEKGRFLALIGNVLSFAIAIGVGLALNPAAREIWAKPHG